MLGLVGPHERDRDHGWDSWADSRSLVPMQHGLPPYSQATAVLALPQEPPGLSASVTLLRVVKIELFHISLV